MWTRLGEADADAFTIMRIAGPQQRDRLTAVRSPTPENMERAFERLEKLNAAKFEQGGNPESGSEGARGGHKFGHSPKGSSLKKPRK
jgi:hypothetical protein